MPPVLFLFHLCIHCLGEFSVQGFDHSEASVKFRLGSAFRVRVTNTVSGEFDYASGQGSVCAERYGNLFKFAQADKILTRDGFSCEEPVPCLPQPFALLLFGLSSLLLVPAFPLLVFLLQAQLVLFPVTDQRCRIEAQFLINPHEEGLQMPSFLHNLFDGPVEVFQDLSSGNGYVLIRKESTVVSGVFEKDVFQLHDDSDNIVLFTILVFLLKVGVHAIADFFQFSVMLDDLIGM